MKIKTFVRNSVVSNPRLFDFVKRISRLLGDSNRTYRAIRNYSVLKQHNVRFLQFGSNDGIANDPLREFIVGNKKWTGGLVEPIPHLFQRLRANYTYAACNRLVFIDAAVGPTSKRIEIFRIKRSQMHKYGAMAEQISSTDREHLVKHYVGHPEIANDIESCPCDCLTLSDVMSRCNLDSIDLLHVDIEGGEYDLFMSLDFRNIHPELVIFESIHLSPSHEIELRDKFHANGYDVVQDDMDTIAVCSSLKLVF